MYEISSEERQQLLEYSLELYRRVRQRLKESKSLKRKIDIIILALSVLTTGSLWTLLSGASTIVSGWIGAIASTLITGLSAYLSLVELSKKNQELFNLLDETGQLLARLRGARPLDSEEIWAAYKKLEAKYSGTE